MRSRYTISGHVYATDLSIISGVTVTVLVAGATSSSGPDGSYTVTGVKAGNYTIQFHQASYYDTTVTGVTAHPSQTVFGINGYLRKRPSAFPRAIAGLWLTVQPVSR